MQQIVKESVRRVPHFVVMNSDPIHRVSDPDEMLKESVGYLFIHLVVLGQDKRNLKHA